MLLQVSGTFTFTPTSPVLSNINEIILQCDTSAAPVTVNLPRISTFGGQLTFRVKVIDGSGNAATNRITVNTASGDFFLGSQTQVIVNGNGASIEAIIVSRTQWAAFVNTSQFPLYYRRLIMTPPDVLALNTTAFTLVPAVTGKIIKPVFFVSTLDFNSVAYASAEFLNAAFHSYNGALISPAFTIAFITSSVKRISDTSIEAIQTLNSSRPYTDYLSNAWQILAPSPITLGNSNIIIDIQYTLIDQ